MDRVPAVSVCNKSFQPLGAQLCDLGTWDLPNSCGGIHPKMTTSKNFYDLYEQNKLFSSRLHVMIFIGHFLVFFFFFLSEHY